MDMRFPDRRRHRTLERQIDPEAAALMNRLLEEITPDRLTLVEAADVVEKSTDVILGWIRSGLLPVTGELDSACIAYADLRVAEEREIERKRLKRLERQRRRELEAERMRKEGRNKAQRQRGKQQPNPTGGKKSKNREHAVQSLPPRSKLDRSGPAVAHVRPDPDKNPVVYAGKMERLRYLQTLPNPTGAERAEMVRLRSDLRRFARED